MRRQAKRSKITLANSQSKVLHDAVNRTIFSDPQWITSERSDFARTGNKIRIGFWKSYALALIVGGLTAHTANAVVVLSGGPNNTAPSGQPYFGNVGSLNGASAIYLGNRWVMTASHVASTLPASVNFHSTNYTTVGGTHHTLTNNGEVGLSTNTDIVLFQLSSDPGLPWLNIASAAPTASTTVMMIGNSRIQESSLSYWNVTVNTGPNNDVWNEVTSSNTYNRTGFETTSSQQIRWGVNLIDTTNLLIDTSGPASNRDEASYSTLFGGSSTFPHEAQAILGDSGGAVFSLDAGSNWILSGMMHAVNGYETQPANTAIAGQSTFAADLSFYRNQILTITQIPEPSATAAALLGFSALLTRRSRSGKSRPMT